MEALLACLIDGGYEDFARQALAHRSAAGWPPFAHLALLRAEAVARSSAEQAEGERRALAQLLLTLALLLHVGREGLDDLAQWWNLGHGCSPPFGILIGR